MGVGVLNTKFNDHFGLPKLSETTRDHQSIKDRSVLSFLQKIKKIKKINHDFGVKNKNNYTYNDDIGTTWPLE